jgi:hypothetical protein
MFLSQRWYCLFFKNQNTKKNQNQNIINEQRDQKWKGRKWRTKENLDCLRSKKLRERRQKKIVINRWLHKKEGILGRQQKT